MKKRRLAALCLSALFIASAWVGPAAAAPGQPVPVVSINLIVELVTPTVLKVSLAYTCLPSPTPLGDVTVNVTQSMPLPAQGVGGADLTCDGANRDVEVMVFGGPAFAPGDALATAQACTALTCGTDARKVTIVAETPPLPQPTVPNPAVPGAPALPALPKLALPNVPILPNLPLR